MAAGEAAGPSTRGGSHPQVRVASARVDRDRHLGGPAGSQEAQSTQAPPTDQGDDSLTASACALTEVLRAAGHRVTAPRQLVWEVLTAGGGHPTAQDVLEAAQANDPSLNLSSVYRTLGLLTDLGLVRESKMSGGGASRWELIHTDDMLHLVCEGCGSIEHHGGPFVRELNGHLRESHGFRTRATEVTVFGRCNHCSDAEEASAG